jgi:hypothetical protein
MTPGDQPAVVARPFAEQALNNAIANSSLKKRAEVTVIQSVEELSRIDFQNETTPQIHRVFPRRSDRLMSRTIGPQTVRTITEILFVDRLQQHEHRSLQKFVFERRNSNRSRFAVGAFWNLNPTHGWCAVSPRMDTIQQRLQIGRQIRFVTGGRLTVDSHRTVFSRAAIRFQQPIKINQVSKDCENQLRRTFCQLSYAFRT